MAKTIFLGNHGNTTPTDLFLEIARGTYPGVSTDITFAFNPDVDAQAEESLWEQGGSYTYLTADTELFISSSSASDTNVGVLIEGMTSDYKVKNIPFTFTAGQTQESIGNFFRIFRVTVVTGNVPLGDLYVAESDTLTFGVPDTATKIKAKMAQGNNITQMGLYTVPADHTLYVVRFNTFTRKNKDAVVKIVLRADTAPGFIQTSQFPTFQSVVSIGVNPPAAISPKTDIEIRANTTTNQTEVQANIAYILIDDLTA